MFHISHLTSRLHQNRVTKYQETFNLFIQENYSEVMDILLELDSSDGKGQQMIGIMLKNTNCEPATMKQMVAD